MAYYPIELRLEEDKEEVNWLYVKRHFGTTGKESGATSFILFVANIPLVLNENGIQSCFGDCSPSSCSPIEYLQSLRTCKLFFPNEKELKKALAKTQIKFTSISKDKLNNSLGFQSWLAEYRASRPGREEQENEVNELMSKFDEHTSKMSKPPRKDADGFIAIQRSKKSMERKAAKSFSKSMKEEQQKSVGTLSMSQRLASSTLKPVKSVAPRMKLKIDKRAQHKSAKKERLLKDFYSFQLKQNKREQLDVLRKQFEEDKEKIVKLKASRKFKPY